MTERAPYQWKNLNLDPTGRQNKLLDRMGQWACHALCKGDDRFVPNPSKKVEGLLKEICGRCPVTDECRLHAVSFPETSGIWGGTNYDERILLRKRMHHK